MFKRDPHRFDLIKLLSNANLAKYLDSKQWQWSKLSKEQGKETLDLYTIKKDSLLLAGYLNSIDWFDLDGYNYSVEAKWITRRGPKVAKPKPKPRFKILGEIVK